MSTPILTGNATSPSPAIDFTRIHFDFPVHPAPPGAKETPQAPPGLRILLADDSEDSRHLILSYLKYSDVTVDTASDGKAAVSLFQRCDYDVVLMDVEMPLVDGYAATRECRRYEDERCHLPCPILALTAHDHSTAGRQAREAGFTALLPKPIRKTELLRALARYAPYARYPLTKVRVQTGMEDVVSHYLAKRRAEMPAFRRAAAAGDYETLRASGHKIRGTGEGYGFPPLSRLGAALESAAQQRNQVLVETHLDSLEHYLGTLS